MRIQDLSVTEIVQKLIACPSVTTETNQSVSDLMREWLSELGFDVHAFEYVDGQGVTKFGIEAKRSPPIHDRSTPPTPIADGSQTGSPTLHPGIGYFCHNDVVSVAGWDAPHGGPFDGVIAEDRLWGRGSCDMKGSAAAALAALARIPQHEQTGPIYYFVTGDEECGMTGADWIAQQSAYFQEMLAAQLLGIIGEPTDLRLVNAHKGGYYIKARAQGVAAHSSSDEGKNANWLLIPFLGYLQDLDRRLRTNPKFLNDEFSPNHMSMNLVVQNEPATSNITVAEARCQLYLRPMPNTPWQEVMAEIVNTATSMGVEVSETRELKPVATPMTFQSVQESLQLLEQAEPDVVSYATDGCCLHMLENLIILGPGSIEQAHRSDEFIELQQLNQGVEVFKKFFRHFACT